MTEKTRKIGIDKFAANPGNRGKGRPKGASNKTTTLLKDAILMAGEQAHPEGLVGYLRQQSVDNPSAYMTLLGKVLPLQINGAGEGGEHEHIHIIRNVIVKAK